MKVELHTTFEISTSFTEPDTESVEDIANPLTDKEIETTEKINGEGKQSPEGTILRLPNKKTFYMGLKHMSPGICGRQRLRSACASAQSDQGLCCPLTELDFIECIKKSKCLDETSRMRGMILNVCILQIVEDTFSHSAAHIC